MFEITEIVASPATGIGALDGFQAVCSCGLVMRSSMRTTVQLDVQAHTVWHNNQPVTERQLDEAAEAAVRARSQARVNEVIRATRRAGLDACESGWTGDRCQFRLDHDSPHSNEEGVRYDD